MTFEPERCLSLRVVGRVQGVGFRAATQRQARALGLKGWVRNDADGAVSLCCAGPSPAVEALLEWCHQGPPGARVDRVGVTALADDAALPLPFAVVFV